MLKIVCIVDKENTAIDRLAKGNGKYHSNLEYVVLDVHPKRPDAKQLERFEAEAIDADIIDWQYFRTAEMLREKYDWLKDKKQILTHHNPYSIRESDWNGYDMVIANNETIYKELGSITEKPVEYIPNCIDTDFWLYNQNWEPSKNVIMVANRIESKKGVLEVAKACHELDFNFILVGSVSDTNYFYEVMQTGAEYHEQITDEELRKLYYKSGFHVCNSIDNFESGTNPILEAMLCGVPVISRKIGHVPDLFNGSNLMINESTPDDVESIKTCLLELYSDKKRMSEMRDSAWSTAKNRSFERRAYLYQKMYRRVLYDSLPVSVVVPVYDKPEVMRECFTAIANQTYRNIELIVADDNPKSNKETVDNFARFVDIPVRYIPTSLFYDDYGLARARNMATIEATGEVMVYCDQRMKMEPDAIEVFLKYLKPKHWLYGNKGGKKEFVENFSCINRSDVINAGMFCERMNMYGGMSQETRTRVRAQGIQTEYVEKAKATPIGKSSNRNRKRSEIIRMKNRLFKMYEA